MASQYPSFQVSPYVDFEPYQQMLIGLVQDYLDRSDAWIDGYTEQNRAFVLELIEYLIGMPQWDGT